MLVTPVRIAVAEDLVHVGEELVLIGVFVAVHLAFHRSQVHRLLDLLEIVRNTISVGIDRLFEGANQASPETCS